MTALLRTNRRVDERVLGRPRRLQGGGRPDEARDAQARRVVAEGDEVPSGLAAKDVNAGVHLRAAAARREDLAAAVEQAEGDVGAGQGEPLHQLGDVAEFRRRRLQELEPGRDVVKQVLDRDAGAGPRPDLGDLFQSAARAADLDAGVFVVAGRLGHEGHLRDGRDGGQGLAPKSHGGDLEQVVRRADLRSSVALEGQNGVFAAHAGAVVGDAQEILAALFEFHENAPRPGVQGVLDQLLDGGGGPLDDLARRDLVGGVLV